MQLEQATNNWFEARSKLMRFLSNSEQYTKENKKSIEVDGQNETLKQLWNDLASAESALCLIVSNLKDKNNG